MFTRDIHYIALIFILVTIFCIPLALRWDLIMPEEEIRSHDLLTVYSHYSFLRKAILDWHEFPLRNPYFGGGFPIIASPEDFTFTPFIIPVIPFGEAGGIRISIYLVQISGSLGMFYLCRRVMGLTREGSFFASTTIGLSDFLKSKMWNGFFIQTHYFLFPWIFAFYVKGRGDSRYLMPCAFLMSMVLMDSKYVVPTMFLFLFIWSFINGLRLDDGGLRSSISGIWRDVILISALGAIVSSLSMVKILPMLQILKISMRPVEDYSMIRGKYIDIAHFLRAFLYGTEDQLSLGMGAIPLILIILCLFVSFRKTWRWLVVFFIWGLICLGSMSPLNLSKAIWSIPVFHSMVRQAEYFNFYILFSIAMIGAIVVSDLYKKGDERNYGAGEVRLITFLILILNVLSLFSINYGGYKRIYERPLPPIVREGDFYQIKGIDEGGRPMHRGAPRSLFTHQYYNLLRNVGTIDWDMDIQVIPENAIPKYFIGYDDRRILNPSYRGEFYFARGGNNSLHVRRFTANRIDMDVFVSTPDILVINQNHHRGWNADTGKVVDYCGLLGVSLEKIGSHRIVLRYLPLDFLVGLGVSLAVLLMIGAFWVKMLPFRAIAIFSFILSAGPAFWGILIY
jgi:hypothetical protein